MSEDIKTQKLVAFAAGKSLRLIQTDERLLNASSFGYEKRKEVLLNNDPLNGHYLMKDKKNVNIDKIFSNDFISFLSESISDNKSEVYYNENNIVLNDAKKIAQKDGEAYLLDEEKYADKSKSYAIDQWTNRNSDENLLEAYSQLKNYIDETYNESYFDNSHKVNNKSVPIYSINENALEKIEYIRFFDKAHIDSFIEKYDMLKEISEKILYNSKLQKIDVNDYDSIFIPPIFDSIIENGIVDEAKASAFFNDIFTNVPQKSFYRFLNPIGLIDSMQDDASLHGNDFAQYSYSINITKDALEPSINYFSTKNLANPEYYHDYIILKKDYESVKAPHYNLENNLVADIFRRYNEIVVNALNEFVSSYDLNEISDRIINGEITMLGSHAFPISSDMINILAEITKASNQNLSIDSITDTFKQIKNGESTYGQKKYKEAFQTFIADNFTVKDYDSKNSIVLLNDYLNENEYLVYEDDFVSKINEAFDEFKNDIEQILSDLGKDIIASDIIDINNFNEFLNAIKNDNSISQLLSSSSTLKTFYRKFNDDENSLHTYLKRYGNVVKIYQMFVKFIKKELNKINDTLPTKLTQSTYYKLNPINGQTKIVNVSSDMNLIMNTKEIRSILHEIDTCKIDNNDEIDGINRNEIFKEALNDGTLKAGIYYKSIVNLMEIINKINENDRIYNEEANALSPYSLKINDYKSSYEDMFSRENEFEFEGFLFGRRNYKDMFTNMNLGMNLVYNYFTHFDKNFLDEEMKNYIFNEINSIDKYESIENNIKERLSSILSNEYVSVISLQMFDKLYDDISLFMHSSETIDNDLSNGIKEMILSSLINESSAEIILKKDFDEYSDEQMKCYFYKLTDDRFVATTNSNVIAYFKMLNAMKNVDFVDDIEGQHFYKETKRQKANIFSLNVKNSGLGFELYDYDEVLSIIKNADEDLYLQVINDTSNIVSSSSPFVSGLSLISFDKINHLSNSMLSDDEEEFDPLKFKYFYKETEKTKETIKMKIKLRKLFEDSVRKSIHRYIPVNTTLWQIKYSDD